MGQIVCSVGQLKHGLTDDLRSGLRAEGAGVIAGRNYGELFQ